MSTPVSASLNPGRRISQTDRVAFRARGRICAHDGCDTILSIYNLAQYCGTHASQIRRRPSRGSAQTKLQVACAHCGDEFETRNTHRKYCGEHCRMAAFARRKRAAELALRLLVQQTPEPTGSRVAGLPERDPIGLRSRSCGNT